jgi:hypothetical protein
MTNVRNILIGLVCAFLAGIIVSCGGGGGGYGGGGGGMPGPAATVIRSASLTGAQEVPPTGATGTGRGAVVVNPTTMEITGGTTFTGLTGAPTAAHIHRFDGTPFLPLNLAADNATATVPAGTVLSSADYAELLVGYLYFNVHTAANPNGEIRGQITGTTGVTAGLATLNSAQETPPGASTATGRGTIVFDSTTHDILICYVTHNVTNTTVAHIHTGAPGVSGPADVVTLTKGTNVYYAPTTPSPVTLTPTNVTNIDAGNTYFNVHSSNLLCGMAGNTSCAAGEIRGQIAIQ